MAEPRRVVEIPFEASPGRLEALLRRLDGAGGWARGVEVVGRAGVASLELPASVAQPAGAKAADPEGAPFVLHVLSLGDPLGPLAETVAAVEAAGGALGSIRALSETTPGAHALCLRLPAASVARLRASLAPIALRGRFDVVLEEDSFARARRRLVVMDVDSTLIRIEVIDELARAAGRYEQVAAITERAMRGELDFSASLRERVAALAGVPATVLSTLAERLPLSEGAERLFPALRALGIRTAILSGGFLPPVRALQAQLGIDHAFANELEVADGRLTGRVLGPIVDAERKAALLASIAAEHRIPLAESIAVGDGANDRLMLQRAGLGLAFRAKPKLREVAHGCLDAWGLDGLLPILGLHARDVPALLEGAPAWP